MDALRSYAEWAPRPWKDQLTRDWMRAGSRWPGEWAFLQQLRNQFGPRWLMETEFDFGQ